MRLVHPNPIRKELTRYPINVYNHLKRPRKVIPTLRIAVCDDMYDELQSLVSLRELSPLHTGHRYAHGERIGIRQGDPPT